MLNVFSNQQKGIWFCRQEKFSLEQVNLAGAQPLLKHLQIEGT